jgi:GH15 family glucan-1,4-alpha-glucosidase
VREEGYAPIGDYAIISDQRSAAMVAKDGAIDWLCAPRFDSDPLFARLLDAQRGGACELRPVEPFTVERSYAGDTNILQTTFTTPTGTLRVTDALTISARMQRFSHLVRRAECLSGEVDVRWAAAPRAGWGCEPAQLRHADEDAYVLACGAVEVMVQAFDLGLAVCSDGEVRGAVRLTAGDSGVLSLLITHSFPLLKLNRGHCEERLGETRTFWRSWMEPLEYDGPWADAVRRSVLALGACVHDETGAMVAAPTTSLPEVIGGNRNFDYRYCWVRDTSFALDAALQLGLTQLAQATLGWLLRSEQRTHPRVNVFFDLDAEPYRPQQEMPLAGYRASTPVLSGNDAGSQLQLGCYGDLMETAFLLVRSGSVLDERSALHLAEVADHVCEIWRNPDAGIWELDDRRDYTHSKVGCWLALDRAAQLAAGGHLRRPHADHWRATQAQIGAWIEEHCFEDGILRRDGNGSGDLDCAMLLVPRSNFIAATDPRFNATIDAIREELGAGGPLVYRYTGMREEENAFLPCSFWLVEALASAHRVAEATALMDELVGLTTHVGLLAEEMDPADHSMRGNLPLCLSHLALLNAAACVNGNARG